MIQSFKNLDVWQKSVNLCVEIYKITENFPKSEIFGLSSQIRRCTVAIPSNIAEGQSRGHRLEYIQFLRIAYASGCELETQLLISKRIGYLSDDWYLKLSVQLTEILKMLNGLMRKI